MEPEVWDAEFVVRFFATGKQNMKGKYGASSFGFEDLEAYQAGQALQMRIYKLANLLPKDEKFGLAQQMRRTAVSLTNNLAEGYGRFTWQDSTHFCRQARGSLMELVDDINICAKQQYAQAEHLADLKRDAEKVLLLLNRYIKYLQKNKLCKNTQA